jgi:hypothetical protein
MGSKIKTALQLNDKHFLEYHIHWVKNVIAVCIMDAKYLV